MTYTKIFLFCLLVCVLGIAGCASNTSTNSGFGSGSGFTIDLRTTNSILPQGGQATLIASVKDAQGNPVNDSTRGVLFTSSQGGKFTFDNTSSVNSAPIILGVCQAIYTAPGVASTTQPNVVIDQITASYQGAFAFVSIEVYK
jgi:hypothetical protein